jgi:molybdenum cofactor guanylyltransferase
MLDRSEQENITGVVLAGGRGSRMGGQDKGLVELAGRPLVAHVLDALGPQVGRVIVNANRNLDIYRGLGFPVFVDDLAEFQGPLAGFAGAMAAAGTGFVLLVPCDGPELARDFAERLYRALHEEGAEIAVAHDGRRLQPVHALLATSLLPDLQRFLAQGDRKIDRWYARHRVATVDFSDRPDMFRNVNTPDERDALEQEMGSRA